MAAGTGGGNGVPKNDDTNDMGDEGNGYVHQQDMHGVDELQADEWGLGADILDGDDDDARADAGGDGDDEESDLGAGIFFVVVVLAIGWFAVQPRNPNAGTASSGETMDYYTEPVCQQTVLEMSVKKLYAIKKDQR
ncbi:hypothetical protein LPJ73_007407, partial [Coemansia sp. RSA 2703]